MTWYFKLVIFPTMHCTFLVGSSSRSKVAYFEGGKRYNSGYGFVGRAPHRIAQLLVYHLDREPPVVV